MLNTIPCPPWCIRSCSPAHRPCCGANHPGPRMRRGSIVSPRSQVFTKLLSLLDETISDVLHPIVNPTTSTLAMFPNIIRCLPEFVQSDHLAVACIVAKIGRCVETIYREFGSFAQNLPTYWGWYEDFFRPPDMPLINIILLATHAPEGSWGWWCSGDGQQDDEEVGNCGELHGGRGGGGRAGKTEVEGWFGFVSAKSDRCNQASVSWFNVKGNQAKMDWRWLIVQRMSLLAGDYRDDHGSVVSRGDERRWCGRARKW